MTFIDQTQTRGNGTGALSTSGLNQNSPKNGVILFVEGSPPRSPHTFHNTSAPTTEDLSGDAAGLPTSPASLPSSLPSPRGPSRGSTLYIDAQEGGLIDHSCAQLLRYFKTAIGQIWVCHIP